MKKTYLSVIFFLGLFGTTLAQMQVGQGINGWYNKSPQAINMSLLTLHSVPTLTFEAGTRLDAFKNRPTNGNLIAGGYLSNGVGAGLKISHESAGLTSALDAQMAFVYYVPLSQNGDKLSFSLGGHFIQNKLQVDNVIVLDPNDPAMAGISEFQPNGNASAGLSVLRENKYYIGISAFNLFQIQNTYFSNIWENRNQRTYYFVGAYNFGLSENFDIEVNGAGVFANAEAYAWDAGFDAKLKRTLWAGVGYKSAGALKFNAGITAQSWSFGYMCTYGSWVDARTYTYKAVQNSVFLRKIFNEGRPTK